MKKYLPLILLILLFEAVSGGIGHWQMGSVREWYPGLNRPSFAPPNWVFPIVWPTLYAMIATAGWFIWRMPQGRERKCLLGLLAAFMLFNWGWSFIFFGAKAMFAAFLWLLANDIIAVWLIAVAWRHERRVAWLMMPALCWMVFAAVLNYSYWQLNQ